MHSRNGKGMKNAEKCMLISIQTEIKGARHVFVVSLVSNSYTRYLWAWLAAVAAIVISWHISHFTFERVVNSTGDGEM